MGDDITSGGALAGSAAAAAPAAGAAAPAAPVVPAAGAAPAAPAAGSVVPAASDGTVVPAAAGAAAPAAGSAAPAAAGGSIAAGGAPAAAAAAQAVPATFPETWRKDMAGEDAAFAKVLERYASPKAFAEAHRSLLTRLSSGDKGTKPPEGATAEQLAEWRKEAGLPAEPKGYVEAIKLPNGVVPGEADKPLLDGFAAHAHKANMPADAFNSAVDWYFANVDAQNKARTAADHAFAGEAAATLQAEWGPAFKENQNRIAPGVLFPADVAEILYNARDSKGRIVGNIPEVVRALAQVHRDAFPAYTGTGADAGGSSQAVATEMQSIESLMGDQRSKYWEKNSSGQLTDGAKAIQSRYRDLVTQAEKNKQRAA